MSPCLIAGMDEVGMGPLAGPICVAVVVVHRLTPKVEGVDDSKKLSPKKREQLVPNILKASTWVGVGWASSRVIDLYGVGYAWNEAADQAMFGMPEIDMLLVDGTRFVGSVPSNRQKLIAHGDG